MNMRSILLLVAAVGVAGGTAYYANAWISNERAAFQASAPIKEIVKAPTLEVLVAKKDLQPGAFVQKKDLQWLQWPEGGIVEGYAVKGEKGVDDFEGVVVRYSIGAGQPITDSRVVQPGDRGFLSAVLKPGKRAVSVPVNATTGISGFIFPGDRLQVLSIEAFLLADRPISPLLKMLFPI